MISKSFDYILEDNLDSGVTVQYLLSIDTVLGKNDCDCGNPECLTIKEDCARVDRVTVMRRVEIRTTYPNTDLKTKREHERRDRDDW